MTMGVDCRDAISLVTTAVRLPSDWELDASLIPAAPKRGSNNNSDRAFPFLTAAVGKMGYDLATLPEFAAEVAGHQGVAAEIELDSSTGARLHWFRVPWRKSTYYDLSDDERAESGDVLCFAHDDPTADAPSRSDWREFVLRPRPSIEASETADERDTVLNIIGQLAVRRSLLSIEAQRRFYKIVLPWGRVTFHLASDRSAEYLIVPVLTLTRARAESVFRRTITLTHFLLPDVHAVAPALDALDLAELCRQVVWLQRNDTQKSLVVDLQGPLRQFIAPVVAQPNTLPLATLIDAVIFRVLRDQVKRDPQKADQENMVRRLATLSRARSSVFGTSAHMNYVGASSVWERIVNSDDRMFRRNLLTFLTASPNCRNARSESMSARFERMRVTNPYEPDEISVLLYNPLSGYFLNVASESAATLPASSAKWRLSWLYLLMSSTCSIKEILRSYHYEVGNYRSVIDHRRPELAARKRLRFSGKPRRADDTSLVTMQNLAMQVQDDIDLVYSFELNGLEFAAVQQTVLKMEGVPSDRDDVLSSLKTVTNLLQSRDIGEVEREIAASAASTDQLTVVVILLTGFDIALHADLLSDLKLMTNWHLTTKIPAIDFRAVAEALVLGYIISVFLTISLRWWRRLVHSIRFTAARIHLRFTLWRRRQIMDVEENAHPVDAAVHMKVRS